MLATCVFAIALLTPWARFLLGLADHDRAFASLDRACEERAGYLVYLNVDPAVDPIRNDPRFGELLRKTKRPGILAA